MIPQKVARTGQTRQNKALDQMFGNKLILIHWKHLSLLIDVPSLAVSFTVDLFAVSSSLAASVCPSVDHFGSN